MRNADADPVLDPAVLDSLRELAQDGEPDLFRDVLRLFLDDAAVRVAAIAAAVEAGDAAALQRAAHALKGASATIGAKALQAACRALEEVGRSGAMQNAAGGLAAMRREYARVQEAIDHLL